MDNTITILFLSADPENTPPLELNKECNDINDELQYSRGTDLDKGLSLKTTLDLNSAMTFQ